MSDATEHYYRKEFLDERERSLRREVSDINRKLTGLDEFVRGNGKPPLERRIMNEVAIITARIERHGARNMQQADGDLKRAIENETKARETQHERNVALLKWIVGTGLTLVGLMLTAIGLLVEVLLKK